MIFHPKCILVYGWVDNKDSLSLNLNPPEYLNDSSAVILTRLRRNKSLAHSFTVGKQDFRATTKINVSLKFIQYSATF